MTLKALKIRSIAAKTSLSHTLTTPAEEETGGISVVTSPVVQREESVAIFNGALHNISVYYARITWFRQHI